MIFVPVNPVFADDVVMYVPALGDGACYIYRRGIILLHLPSFHPVEFLRRVTRQAAHDGLSF